MKLRYTGDKTVTFLSPPIGTVEPGQEFWVSDDDIDRLIHRTDVEAVEGGTEGLEELPTAESPATPSEVAETPVPPRDAPIRKRPAAKTDSSGSADDIDR